MSVKVDESECFAADVCLMDPACPFIADCDVCVMDPACPFIADCRRVEDDDDHPDG